MPISAGSINGTPSQAIRINSIESNEPPVAPLRSVTSETGNREQAGRKRNQPENAPAAQLGKFTADQFKQCLRPCHAFEIIFQRILAQVQLGQRQAVFLYGVRQLRQLQRQIENAQAAVVSRP